MPWWHAPQTDWYGVLGRFPLGMGVLRDTASLSDRRTSVSERLCSAADEGRWWVEAIGHVSCHGHRKRWGGAHSERPRGLARL